MEKDTQKMLDCITSVKAPLSLADEVFARIERHAVRRARLRFSAFVSVSFATFSSMLCVSFSLVNSLKGSGFYDYASLVFSDSGAVLMYWKEFFLSFVESLPILGLAAFVALAVVFLWTGAKAAQSFRPAPLFA
jgi:hypothetical protein